MRVLEEGSLQGREREREGERERERERGVIYTNKRQCVSVFHVLAENWK